MNILYLHTHDTGRYIMPYGYMVPTPNLMELARDATLFRQCHTPSPTCSPSRGSLLTGMYPHSNGLIGLVNRGFSLNDKNQHIVSYLNGFNYETALSGIQHEDFTGEEFYQKVLFESDDLGMYFEDPEAFDVEAATTAAAYIKDRAGKDGNFFLSVGLINTHRDLPPNREKYKQDYLIPPANLFDCKTTREDMSDYCNSAEIADRCFGIVLDALKESGLEDETVIVLTTDHGIPFPRHKCHLYDTGTGVALIIRHPGSKTNGKALDSLVSNIDVFPTLCDLCGIPKPEWLQGVSLAELLSGEKEEVREEVFGEINYHASYEPVRSIRTQRYKLIRRFDYHNKIVPSNTDNGISKKFVMEAGWLDKKPNEREQLFDLYLDPMETTNLVNDPQYQEIYCDLSERLVNWMEETDDPLLEVLYRIPRPEHAEINKLTCLHAEIPDYETD
ncbi:MAG: sulfatase [Saccharofermentanales bacterium]